MSIFMETTKIEAARTVGEIQELLAAAGCCGVMTLFDDKKEVKAVSFQVMFQEKTIAFRLPCKWEPIYNKLRLQIRRPRPGVLEGLESQAKRVAWRQILRWVQAQLALIDTEMVKVHEVFLPYVQVNIDGQTFFEKIES